MSDYKFKELIYLNNCLGSFYSDFLKWLSYSYYLDFKNKIISTYSKTIRKLINERNNETDSFDTILPTVILDPSGDFNIVKETDRLWSYPGLAPYMGSRLFDPVFEDDNVVITPVFHRFSGSMQVTMLLQSIYEYIDMRIQTVQFFKGEERWSRPFIVTSFIVIPDELINLKYIDENDNLIDLDWANKTELEEKLIINVNQNKKVLPVLLTPIIKYTSISDNSTKNPGTDLESYSLTVDFEYEIDLPVYLFVESDYKVILPPTLKFMSGYDGERYNFPEDIIIDGINYKFKRTYLLEITEEKLIEIIDNNNSLLLNENITNDMYIIISLDGYKLTEKTDYIVTNDILKFKVELKKDEIIEYSIYVKMI